MPLVSWGGASASAVAAAATWGAKGTITAQMAGVCTVIAFLSSVVVNIPLVLVAHERPLMRRLAWTVGLIAVVGLVGVLAQAAGGAMTVRLWHEWGRL